MFHDEAQGGKRNLPSPPDLLGGGCLMLVNQASCESPAFDQHPEMRMYQIHPKNGGTPLEALRQAFVTPQACFFVRNHGAVPHVNGENYRLSVVGQVQVPLSLSLDELCTTFPSSTTTATLQCA